MRWLCLSLVAVACRGDVTVESWSVDAADATCRFQESCDAADFYAVYDTLDACETLTVAYWDGLSGYLAGCTFGAEQANLCLDALHGRCDDWAADEEDLLLACSQSFDCDDGGFVFSLEPAPEASTVP